MAIGPLCNSTSGKHHFLRASNDLDLIKDKKQWFCTAAPPHIPIFTISQKIQMNSSIIESLSNLRIVTKVSSSGLWWFMSTFITASFLKLFNLFSDGHGLSFASEWNAVKLGRADSAMTMIVWWWSSWIKRILIRLFMLLLQGAIKVWDYWHKS